jgi:hypothetical protein
VKCYGSPERERGRAVLEEAEKDIDQKIDTVKGFDDRSARKQNMLNLSIKYGW